jgi:hypothetical protein
MERAKLLELSEHSPSSNLDIVGLLFVVIKYPTARLVEFCSLAKIKLDSKITPTKPSYLACLLNGHDPRQADQ